MVSNDWSIELTLEDVLERIVGGGTPSRDVPEYYKGSIPWATVKDMKAGRLFDTLEHVTEKAVSDSAANIIPSGTVIMATRMAVGKCFVAMTDMAINQDLKALIPRKDKLDTDFLMMWLQHKQGIIESMGTGTTVKGVRLEQIKSMPICLPPLSEQRKIAAILTSVDKAIEKTEAIIKQTEVVKKGLMQRLLTKGIGHTEFKETEIGEIPIDWDLVEMDSITSIITNGFVGVASPFYSEDYDAVSYLMSNNIRENRIDLTKHVKVTKKFSDQHQKSIMQKGDLLMVQSGHVGTTCVIPDSLLGSNCHALLILRLVHSIVNPYFVSYYLNSNIGKKRLETIFVGSTIPHINGKDLKKYEIPLPPISEQIELVKYFQNIDDKLSNEQQSVKSLTNLKNSLMQVLLKGKVRVNVDEYDEVVV